MEIGQGNIKTESANNDSTNEVNNEKPVSNVKEYVAEKISKQPSSELLTKIKNQIEFYFGDVNMQRDQFLIERTKLDEGWIPMHVMLRFRMLAAMSKDVDVILKALESSELIEVSEDKTKIRRSLEYPLAANNFYREAEEARTVFVRGFPLQDMQIETLKTFFNAYDPYETIIIKTYLYSDKTGSIFIRFKTLADAKAFMDRGPIKYGESELTKKWFNDYAKKKAKKENPKWQRRSEMRTMDPWLPGWLYDHYRNNRDINID